MALWIKTVSVQVLSGELKTWVRVTPSGRQMRCQFCPACGTRVFHQTAGQEGVLSIKPGTLNDTRWLRPVAHIWSQSAQPWIQFGDACRQFPGNPPGFDEIVEAWQRYVREGGVQ